MILKMQIRRCNMHYLSSCTVSHWLTCGWMCVVVQLMIIFINDDHYDDYYYLVSH